MTLRDYLLANQYPGRLNLVARTRGGNLVAVVLITGRSLASKNRALIVGKAPALLRVVPTSDEAPDDGLRHYVAAAQGRRWIVIGNGDHVSQLADGLDTSGLNTQVLSALRNEPDPPIFTPRIAAGFDQESGAVWLLSAQHDESVNGSGRLALWNVWEVSVGQAYVVSTYVSDGEQIVTNPGLINAYVEATTPEDLIDEVWSAADERFRIAAGAIVLDKRDHAAVLRPRQREFQKDG